MNALAPMVAQQTKVALATRKAKWGKNGVQSVAESDPQMHCHKM